MDRWKKLDDRGSALVTVMVVVTFITILATLLLFGAMMNYQMKQVDYGNKRSFYEGEEVLDRLKAAFIQDVSTAYANAYDTTIVEYARYSDPDRFMPEERVRVYKKEFVIEMKELLEGRAGEDKNPLEALKNMVPAEYSQAIVDVGEIIYAEASGYVSVQGIKVSFTDEKNFTTVITTDIYVEAPSYTGEEELVTYKNSVTFLNWEKQ